MSFTVTKRVSETYTLMLDGYHQCLKCGGVRGCPESPTAHGIQ